MAMEVEDLTAEELVAGLEKCTFDVLLPLMPRVLELVEKVRAHMCLLWFLHPCGPA